MIWPIFPYVFEAPWRCAQESNTSNSGRSKPRVVVLLRVGIPTRVRRFEGPRGEMFICWFFATQTISNYIYYATIYKMIMKDRYIYIIFIYLCIYIICCIYHSCHVIFLIAVQPYCQRKLFQPPKSPVLFQGRWRSSWWPQWSGTRLHRASKWRPRNRTSSSWKALGRKGPKGAAGRLGMVPMLTKWVAHGEFHGDSMVISWWFHSDLMVIYWWFTRNYVDLMGFTGDLMMDLMGFNNDFMVI